MRKSFRGAGQSRQILNVQKIAVIGLLGALTIILGLTPLGFIPIGPTRATIMHIPVIIGGILYGPVVGGLTGFVFGLFSLFNAVANPTPTSFAFIHPLVSIVPRVLIGVVAHFVYRWSQKLSPRLIKFIFGTLWIGIIGYLLFHTGQALMQKNWLTAGSHLFLTGIGGVIAYFIWHVWKEDAMQTVLAAVFGTLTNTFGVLGMIYILFAERFVAAMGLSTDLLGQVIFGVGLVNGIPEVILSVLIVTSVVRALKKYVN